MLTMPSYEKSCHLAAGLCVENVIKCLKFTCIKLKATAFNALTPTITKMAAKWSY